jgi:PKD repeat protein
MKKGFLLFLILTFSLLQTATAQTTIVLQPGPEGKDAQLWTINPNTNYGYSPKFVCMGWTHYGEPGVNRALVDFDLSVIPENAEITEAKLSFYFVCLEPNYFGHTGNNEAYLQLITEPWEEDDVTWNKQPSTTTADQLYLPPSTDPYQDYTDIDVTGLIHKLYTEPDTYHGLMLRLINEYPYQCLLFASSDYNDTIEFRPRLEITYTFCEAPVTGFSFISEALTFYFEDTTSSADGRYWDFGDGYYSDLINPWHTYDFPGEYTVCLRTWNSCGSDTLCKALSMLTQDVRENIQESFSIYPNPAGDYFMVSANIQGQAELTAFDLSGREMLSQQVDFLSGRSGRISTGKLPSGIYFARITSGRITGTVKIIVNH